MVLVCQPAATVRSRDLKICTVAEMRAWEQAAGDRGVGVPALMERAGAGVAAAVLRDPRCFDPVLVLAGPGNNGGDALIAAQRLHERGRQVRVILWRREQGAAPQPPAGVATSRVDDAGPDELRGWLAEAGTIVDGLLGTGRSRPAAGVLKEVLTLLTERRAAPAPPRVVAVDVPSGIDADTGAADALAVRADRTVALGCAKAGALIYPAAAHVGELTVAAIGLPADAAPASGELVTRELVARLLPPREPDSNKGTYGKALVVGGSERYTGAPSLVAWSAGRVGAGLVTVAMPRCVHPILAAKLTEAIFAPQPDHEGALARAAVDALAGLCRGQTAVAIGPGLSQHAEAPDAVRALLAALRADRGQAGIVIDADGLNALAGHDRWWGAVPENCVLTPHPGEMGRLRGSDAKVVQADRVGTARAAAAEWRQVVVLKGANTIVARPDGRWWLMQAANPALATAGTGDVLCGAISGLLAQGMEAWAAAVCGVWAHAEAGAAVAQQYGAAGVLAGDLLPELPRALQRARASDP